MTKNNLFKTLGLAAITALFSVQMNAQQTSGDVAKQGDIVPGATATAGTVRIIDNKGTIKYLQVKNGLTLLSNTTADVTTTTWQLGGSLTDATYIDVDTNVFALDGIDLVDTGVLAASVAQTTAGTEAAGEAGDGTDHGGTGTGWTVLVRDESTGAVKKILASELIQLIESGHQVFTATAGQTTYTVTTGGTPLPTFSQVWVYRNGAKLIANVDYTVSGADVTLVPGGTAPNNWAVIADDIIEIQFVK